MLYDTKWDTNLPVATPIDPFLPAADLHCSEADRAAAIEVLRMLEHGELVHAWEAEAKDRDRTFSIKIWDSGSDVYPECGTVRCIGGWMEHTKGEPLECCRYTNSGINFGEWADVFTPPRWTLDKTYNIPRCAKALRAKLMTGKADWSV